MTKIPVTNGREFWLRTETFYWENPENGSQTFVCAHDKKLLNKEAIHVAEVVSSVSLDDLRWLIEYANKISIEEEWSHSSISMTKLFNIQNKFANLLKEEK